MNIYPTKKIYFLSDFHLGAPDYDKSLVREKKIVSFKDVDEVFNEENKYAASIFTGGYFVSCEVYCCQPQTQPLVASQVLYTATTTPPPPPQTAFCRTHVAPVGRCSHVLTASLPASRWPTGYAPRSMR